MEQRRLFDLLENYKNKFASKHDAFASKENGSWINYSSSDYINYTNALSCGLLAMGLNPGDRIASVSNNRPEWNFLDMALSQTGMIHVPIYPTISDSDFLYILTHAEPKLIFLSDKLLVEKVRAIADTNSISPSIYTFIKLESERYWKEIYELGLKHKSDFEDKLTGIKNSVREDDLATIIYTSGTTSNPKGVMLSHKNILSNVAGIQKIFDFNETHRTLSFLPISHVFERTINYYFQSKGVSIYYAENLGTISANLKEVNPHVLIAVPRVLERIYDRIIGRGKDLKGISKRIFFWAVSLGLRFEFNRDNGWFYHLKLKLADHLVFSKWRDAVGGNISIIVAGGAAMQPRLIRIFNAAGIPLVEGYGMTETSPVIAANDYFGSSVKIGTVGPLLPGVQVKISDDGEILVKSDCVMLGYYKNTELTNETIDNESWLHTGDIGVFIDNKFLKITDRKKEIFKLSSGKYVSPQAIENIFKESFFIEQVFVFGENQKFASALIAPNFPFLHNWCSIHGVKYRDNAELIKIPEVIQRYQKEVNSLNKRLGQTEQIKRFRLIQDEWTPQTSELSPTLKLRRRYLMQKYNTIIEEIYAVDTIGKVYE